MTEALCEFLPFTQYQFASGHFHAPLPVSGLVIQRLALRRRQDKTAAGPDCVAGARPLRIRDHARQGSALSDRVLGEVFIQEKVLPSLTNEASEAHVEWLP